MSITSLKETFSFFTINSKFWKFSNTSTTYPIPYYSTPINKYFTKYISVDKIQLAPIEVAVKRETLSSSSNNKRRFDSESKDDDDFEIPLASIKKKKQSENIVVNNQTVTKISNLNSSVFQEGDYAARNIVDSNLSGRSEVAEEIEVIPDLVPMELGSDYHYLMSICHFMNKVKDERKIHVRMKILELLCEELSQEF